MDTHGIDLLPALTEVYGAVPDGAQLIQLAGDASTRTYYRLRVPGGAPSTLIVMHLPVDPLASDEASGGAAATELPFLSVQRLLHARGVPVPQVLAHDVPRRVVLLEDLGTQTLFDAQAASDDAGRMTLYERAVDLLADMHRRCAAPADALPYQRHFDRSLLRWELDHFRQWALEALGGPLPAASRAALDAEFDRLVERIAQLPTGFVHRDYQSRNLMRTPDGRLVVIDFQDALRGPYCYDLVALLCDSYVDFSPATQQRLIQRYADAMGHDAAACAALASAFDAVALQRKLKDAGRFVYIDRVRGNPAFLRWFPSSVRYAGRALARQVEHHPQLADLLPELLPGFPDAVPVPQPQTGTVREAR